MGYVMVWDGVAVDSDDDESYTDCLTGVSTDEWLLEWDEVEDSCGCYEPECEYCTPWQDASEEEKMEDPEATVSEAGEAICPMCSYLEVCCICDSERE